MKETSALNGYEIRYNLLTEARVIIYDNWNAAKHEAQSMADFDKCPVKYPPPPTAEDITALAEALYAFVQKKS